MEQDWYHIPDEDDMSAQDRAYMEAMDRIEGYCDYCDKSGHTFASCPARDDSYYEDLEWEADQEYAFDEEAAIRSAELKEDKYIERRFGNA